jgi:hypothetical protein
VTYRAVCAQNLRNPYYRVGNVANGRTPC